MKGTASIPACNTACCTFTLEINYTSQNVFLAVETSSYLETGVGERTDRNQNLLLGDETNKQEVMIHNKTRKCLNLNSLPVANPLKIHVLLFCFSEAQTQTCSLQEALAR